MRTTIRSSDGAVLVRATALLMAAVWPCAVAGCASPTDPADLMSLSPESAAHKAMQTRYFETSSEDELLSASAAVLQDLGFQISESVSDLGFLRATKERSARERGQQISRVLIAVISSFGLISGTNTLVLNPVDLHQQINASLLTRSLDERRSRYEVRILFYRLVWKSDGSSGDTYIPPGDQRSEMVRDGGIYQQFFAKLSKAVFLEAHKI